MTDYIQRGDYGKEHPYYMGLRKVAQNRSLSWEVRGVIAYLLSQPKDWMILPEDLQQGCGRDKAYSLLKELIEAGYMERKTFWDAVDQKSRCVYYFYEEGLPEKPEIQGLPEKAFTPLPDALHNREKETEKETPNSPPAAPPMGAAGGLLGMIRGGGVQGKPEVDMNRKQVPMTELSDLGRFLCERWVINGLTPKQVLRLSEPVGKEYSPDDMYTSRPALFMDFIIHLKEDMHQWNLARLKKHEKLIPFNVAQMITYLRKYDAWYGWFAFSGQSDKVDVDSSDGFFGMGPGPDQEKRVFDEDET